MAIEKDYWENQYMVDDVKGVPRDTVRQDMRKFDKRREGFARILDLIRRRDGVELEEDKIPKDVSFEKGVRASGRGARVGAAALASQPSGLFQYRRTSASHRRFYERRKYAEFRQAIAAFTNDANSR